MVSAQKLMRNLTKIVVFVWVFVVLILTSSYTASLSSILTVQQLIPAATDLRALIRGGANIGYMTGSRSSEILADHNARLKDYDSPEEYNYALSRGSSKGGVSAIIDETPYIKIFLSKYCNKYTMVETVYKTNGFGFAFPKGSTLATDISREILRLSGNIESVFYRGINTCPNNDSTTEKRLDLDSFSGLFLITGITSTLALLIFGSHCIYIYIRSLHEADDGTSIWRKLMVISRSFLMKKWGSNSICF